MAKRYKLGTNTLAELRGAIHGLHLRYRAIDHLVYGSRFKEFFEKHDVSDLLKAGKLNEVRKQMEEYYGEELTYKKLRYKAAAMHIPNYSRMSKEQLEKNIDEKANVLRHR